MKRTRLKFGPDLEASPAPDNPADADDFESRMAELNLPPELTAKAGRRTFREKFGAGLLGLKHAVRGDSSFFAHFYRALLIALTAGLLGVDPVGWCFLVLSAALVIVAELAHSAIDTLARTLGDPEEPGLKMAREIATAGVLVAVVTSAAIAITVLTIKFGDLLGWWR